MPDWSCATDIVKMILKYLRFVTVVVFERITFACKEIYANLKDSKREQ